MQTSQVLERQLSSEAATTDFAVQFAQAITPFVAQGLMVYLSGELGVGKTFLTRQLLRAFGYKGVVKSPTYGLVEVYGLPIGNICHFDLYRLNTSEELEDLGFRDYCGMGCCCLVEWPSRGLGALPAADLALILRSVTEKPTARTVTLTAASMVGERVLLQLKNK